MKNQQFKNIKLVVLDVDGVLLDSKLGGFKDILIILDKSKEVKEIDKEYQKRKHLGPWGLEQLAELYKGVAKKELNKIAFNYCTDNLMKGAKSLVNGLRKNNYIIGAISSNPQFIMNALKKILKLDFSEGGKLEFEKGISIGRIKEKMDRYKKAETLKRKIIQYNLQKENTIVIGDSITDLPIAKAAGFFIAYNTKKQEVIKKADLVIKQKNLKNILKLI